MLEIRSKFPGGSVGNERKKREMMGISEVMEDGNDEDVGI